jgi:hypothetical protein
MLDLKWSLVECILLNIAWFDYKLYLQLSLTIMSIDLSSVALIRLALCATHLYVPISVFLTLLRDNVCFSCPIPLICRLSLYQITFAGGFPPLPLHAHLILYGWTGTIDCHSWLHWKIMYRVIIKAVISWGVFYV